MNQSLAVAALLLAACSRSATSSQNATGYGLPVAGSAESAAPRTLQVSSARAASSAAEPEARSPKPNACPADMVLAAGNFCPLVEQTCLQHTKEYDLDREHREKLKEQGLDPPMSRVSERCLSYRNPTTCLSKERAALRFCIDRYEWPNKAGELPALMVTWLQAKEKCEAAGKRLCDADEFTFACEGEEMRPYAYGFERDATACNVDKPYVAPTFKATPYDDCLKLPACKKQLDAIDQRVPSGSLGRCQSPFGAFDINGNVNEWVNRPGEQAPWRSGLKGGWWGPARSRCRPLVTAHNEIYAGYEVGFRCCKNAPPP